MRRPGEIGKLVGHDVRGFKHAVSNQSIRHALKKHGVGGTELARGQKPLTLQDFGKLPAIIRGGKAASAKMRAFGPKRFKIIAKIDGDTFHYVAEARRKKRRLDMVTMWKK